MAALIIIGASLQLVGVVCSYTFSDPALGHGLMTESFDPRRQTWGARIGLVCTIVGFCVSVGAALVATI